RKIEPRSRLIILGAYHPGVRGYTAELMNLTRELNLERHVLYTGMVSQAEVRTYYRRSHLFLSMSEHEGFFVPLVECMYLDIPILAYASSVVPETLGKSGVLFYEKDYRRIAEMMALMVNNKELRSATLATQQERRKAYMPAQTFGIFTDVLSRFGLNF
ncbi:MAG: glycosyltransferase, partial [Leptospiraceae bacterium]|nr:glycosyltransferase [Leptospiraceae bacterium]